MLMRGKISTAEKMGKRCNWHAARARYPRITASVFGTCIVVIAFARASPPLRMPCKTLL